MSKSRRVVYTCVTGKYDVLYNHTYINPKWDYICFTDDNIKNKINSHWQIRPLKFKKLDDVRNQRWHKLHPHELLQEYSHSLYVDANIDILNRAVFDDIDRAISKGAKISISPHPDRDCVYDELEACIQLGKDESTIMKKQIEIMRKDGFPKQFGLFETCIMYRLHNDKEVIAVMEDWWQWIRKLSKRDQLSLTYVLWKNKFDVPALTKMSYRNNNGRVVYWPHASDARATIQDLTKTIQDLTNRIEQKDGDINALQAAIDRKDKELNLIKSSKAWQYLVWLRKMKSTLIRK